MGQLQTQKKGVATESTYFSHQATEFEPVVHPAFLDSDGKYKQDGLPDRMIQCQAQPLTSTGVHQLIHDKCSVLHLDS
jgi:hypothetical protein